MPLNFIEHIDIRMWGSGLREVHGIILIQIILNLKVNARSEFSDHRESYTLRVTQVAITSSADERVDVYCGMQVRTSFAWNETFCQAIDNECRLIGEMQTYSP